jgi:type II secretory pathway predicted ATPase ExeA
MLAAVLQSMPDGQRQIVRVVHDRPGPLTLPRLIAQVLNVPEPEVLANGVMDQTGRRLRQQDGEANVPILAIDDAHHLAADSLDWLGEIAVAGGPKTPQLILVGRPGLAELLSQKQYKALADRLATSRQLEPLSSAEVRHFIERRLWLAGSSTRRLMTGSAVRAAIRTANASPGRIDALLDDALAAGFLHGETKLSSRTIHAVAKRQAVREPCARRNDRMLVAFATIVLTVGLAAFTYRAVTETPPEISPPAAR